MNKKAITQMKAWFLIVNVILGVVAFGWLVSGAETYSPGDGNTWERGDDGIWTSEQDSGRTFRDTEMEMMGWKKPQSLGGDIDKGNVDVVNEVKEQPSKNIVTGISPKYNEFTNPDGKRTFILKDGTQLKTDKFQELDGEWFITNKKGEQFSISKEVLEENEIDTSKLKEKKPVKQNVGTKAILSNAIQIGTIFGFGYMIGGFIGGNANIALGTAFAAASFVWQVQAGDWGSSGIISDTIKPVADFLDFGFDGLGGVIIGAIVFVIMYKEESIEIVEFNCLPYQPPIGGEDCEKCNDKDGECSEYRCKSLGQACQLLNAGTEEEKCDWVNPRDVNSPKIFVESVLSGYKYLEDGAIRPPATGIVISQENGDDVEAFTALEFTLSTNEPAQCKIDYNLTNGFEEMSYYVGGTNLFSYNHTEVMSLPSPDSINALAPELKNDGTYTLYIRCQDANGNFNQDAFSVRFKVKSGPDTTPPRIVDMNIPSNSPINYNKTSLDLEVYVNEPANCKWSRTDTTYDNMENQMICSNNLWEMNNNNVYTCADTLTGIRDRVENSYYFKCQDVSDNLNTNTQSYLYNVLGTQPLNILSVGPNEIIKGSTDTVPVTLSVKTDNGYNNGDSICSYYNDINNNAPVIDTYYIEFLDTGGNEHTQRQDLDSGTYTYYFKCVDLGGNAAYDSTTFNVEVDRQPPIVVRAYKESGELKIITNEEAECSYSTKDCNFEIETGINMNTYDFEVHTAEWKTSQNYYIRCQDEYKGQPPLNLGAIGCSVVVRPYQISAHSDVFVL